MIVNINSSFPFLYLIKWCVKRLYEVHRNSLPSHQLKQWPGTITLKDKDLDIMSRDSFNQWECSTATSI